MDRGEFVVTADGLQNVSVSPVPPSISKKVYRAMSHLEIFGFQDVIKIKNKTTIFS